MQCLELLTRHNVLRSSDPDESEAVLSRNLCPHVLRLTDCARLHTVQNCATLGFSKLMFVSYGTAVQVTKAQVSDSYIVCLPQSGRSLLRVGSKPVSVPSGHGAVIAPRIPFLIDADQETSALVWRLDRYALERLAGIATGDDAASAVEFAPSLDLTRGPGAGLARALRFVAQELDAGEGVSASPLALERLEQALTFALLDTQPQDWKAARLRHGRGAAPACVRRVEEYLQASIAEGVSTESLVRVSGVSGRTLFRAFRTFRGVSPQEYLRQTRLRKVRDDLKRAQPGSTVTSVLSRWGITQFGRFAAEYKRRFGELPSQTHRAAVASYRSMG